MTPTRGDDFREDPYLWQQFRAFRDETREDIRELKAQLAQCASEKLMDERFETVHKLYGWINELRMWFVMAALAALAGLIWALKFKT